MEDGPPTPGSGDRRDATSRRKTFSGALRHAGNTTDTTSPAGDMRLPWSSPSAPSSPSNGDDTSSPSPATSQRTHRRTISGSLFQRFNFLRPSSDNLRPPSREKDVAPPKSPKSFKSRKSIDDESPIVSPTSPTKESAMAFALRPVKTRKRKSSLRKTALLGTKRILSEGRERKNSLSAKSPLGQSPYQPQVVQNQEPHRIANGPDDTESTGPIAPTSDHAKSATPSLRRQFSYESDNTPSSSDGSIMELSAATAARLTLLTEHTAVPVKREVSAASSSNDLLSPLDLKSPTSQASYASTTDDDDVLTFDRPVNHQTHLSLPKPLSSAATSYFPISTGSLYPASPPPHDYTETEYWGWIILFVTWLTFTVGMGSCLEIWSWAWDVGETPYAPPELEDDPTLPIVGYYPALIVLTGVVAWVWITVAWVGMKYFRHAKIEV
ncbi:hypothetical protein LTR78_000845 [Recurvomyces mirabilis]|uniref:Uncharacterized protein n=1 Tax=Recurvomyces mirabilis TaxID=574656 RepID=A0AAE1C5X2_9PEZI|nr:hypothetical protein LTR78_000845 [Recurvomyces mirabilis]KAK5158814.1 hypothetical protein LTS14_002922 [Recurvomyces mirabilis]